MMADGSGVSASKKVKESSKRLSLQDVFLEAAMDAGTQCTLNLLNGTRLQGRITSIDPYGFSLEGHHGVQFVYKKNVASIATADILEVSGDGWTQLMGGPRKVHRSRGMKPGGAGSKAVVVERKPGKRRVR